MGSFHVCVPVCASTQNDDLGFALDPHSCTGAGRDLHAVLHPGLQPTDHDWTDGCVHWLIDMVAGFVGQAPDLMDTRHRGKERFMASKHSVSQLKFPASEHHPTLYSWMMPFCWSEGGGSHETLMDVLLWLPTVNTVTCWGGAPGADEKDGRNAKAKH